MCWGGVIFLLATASSAYPMEFVAYIPWYTHTNLEPYRNSYAYGYPPYYSPYNAPPSYTQWGSCRGYCPAAPQGYEPAGYPAPQGYEPAGYPSPPPPPPPSQKINANAYYVIPESTKNLINFNGTFYDEKEGPRKYTPMSDAQFAREFGPIPAGVPASSVSEVNSYMKKMYTQHNTLSAHLNSLDNAPTTELASSNNVLHEVTDGMKSVVDVAVNYFKDIHPSNVVIWGADLMINVACSIVLDLLALVVKFMLGDNPILGLLIDAINTVVKAVVTAAVQTGANLLIKLGAKSAEVIMKQISGGAQQLSLPG